MTKSLKEISFCLEIYQTLFYLHDQQLDFVDRQTGLLRHVTEGEESVSGLSFEGHLHHGQKANLFVEDFLVGLEVVLFLPLRLQLTEFGDVARVEGQEDVDEPVFAALLQKLWKR